MNGLADALDKYNPPEDKRIAPDFNSNDFYQLAEILIERVKLTHSTSKENFVQQLKVLTRIFNAMADAGVFDIPREKEPFIIIFIASGKKAGTSPRIVIISLSNSNAVIAPFFLRQVIL